jgi:hypothetical protein
MLNPLKLLAPDPEADAPAQTFQAHVEALASALARHDQDALQACLKASALTGMDGFGEQLRTFLRAIMALPTDDPRAEPWAALYARGRVLREQAIARQPR